MSRIDYLAEDLYRLGNATTPKLDHVRTEGSKDVDTYLQSGLLMVRANGRGVSLLTEAGAASRGDVWLWIIPKSTSMPPGLALHNDARDHYHLCPAFDMTLDEYRALLAKLALSCKRIRKL